MNNFFRALVVLFSFVCSCVIFAGQNLDTCPVEGVVPGSSNYYASFEYMGNEVNLPIEERLLNKLPLDIIERLPLHYVGSESEYFWIGFKKDIKVGLFHYSNQQDKLLMNGDFVSLFKTKNSIYAIKNDLKPSKSTLFKYQALTNSWTKVTELQGAVAGVYSEQWINWGNWTEWDSTYFIVGHDGWAFVHKDDELMQLKCFEKNRVD